MTPFARKVAIVTGAGSGLGREYALALAAHGAAVVVNDLGVAVTGDAPTGNSARLVADEIISRGGRAVASNDSVADWVGAENIVETALNEFGRLDVVVNNLQQSVSPDNHEHRHCSAGSDDNPEPLKRRYRGCVRLTDESGDGESGDWHRSASQEHRPGRR